MLVACLILLALAACGDESTGPDSAGVPGEPATLVLSADAVTFTALGQAEHLSTTVSDANGIALGDASVSWSSADESVATVDGSGRIEAVGVGETDVTASAGGASDAATVVVTQTAASVAVSPTYARLLAIGDSVRLAAVVRDANGNVVPDAAVGWTSTDDAVATVDAAGWVVAQVNGTTQVEAAAGETTAAATILVEQVVAAVAVTPASPTLAEGDTLRLAATAEDANGNAVADATFVWSTADPALVAVDGSGLLTARREGTARLTATAGGVPGEAKVGVLGRIAFASNRSGTLQIYVANEDGSGIVQRTFTTAARRPKWSPDGRRIAFYRGASIWIMDADGSNPVRITDAGGVDLQPAWSPDGTRIAFRSTRIGTGGYGILTVDTDGAGMDTVTSSAYNDVTPAWGPGGRIAFASHRDGDSEIYSVNPDGTDMDQLTVNSSAEGSPAWSPDGERIAFHGDGTGDDDVYVMNADGTGIVNVTNDTGWTDRDPSWSPDGARIFFISDRHGNDELYVMNVDGTGITRLTNDADGDIDVDRRPAP